MRKFFTALLAVALSLSAHAQHTFSMVAVDTVTGALGSAGATCLSFYPMGAQINRIVPGKGVVNTQAWLSTTNRDYAAELLQKGYSAQQVLDSLYANDEYPEDRQNLVIDLNGTGARTAGFTGEFAMSYANHIVGPNYVIAGNILAGPHVLDSMEDAFTRTNGSLADKMMAALMAAKFPGADSRCASTSSLAAFIRLALPGDSVENYTLDLNVMSPANNPFEPIDTLYDRFMAFKETGIKDLGREKLDIIFYPNPTKDIFNLSISGLKKSRVMGIWIEDMNGRKLKQCYKGLIPERGWSFSASTEGLKPGIYIINVDGQRKKLVKAK